MQQSSATVLLFYVPCLVNFLAKTALMEGRKSNTYCLSSAILLPNIDDYIFYVKIVYRQSTKCAAKSVIVFR